MYYDVSPCSFLDVTVLWPWFSCVFSTIIKTISSLRKSSFFSNLSST